ncbi:2-hydroxychromene-2-carboxylate isomerase [Dongia sp.]|uniref:2-hydroxychromene-2-carboxylate isomerase n=1 Tax=Dongia sp. TaxID=1977262 RepID=UPI0035B1A713
MTAGPIEFFFDFSSPYGYLAAHRIEEVGEAFGRKVLWRPILLGAVFKATGQTPLVSQPLRGPYHKHDLLRTARRLKLPFCFPADFPMATIAAARAFYALEAQAPQDAKKLALALFDAAFAQGINISTRESVLDVAEKAGLDPAAVAAGIEDGGVKQRLKDETDGAIARNIFGSPFFVVDGEMFWGNDRIPDLKDWLATGGW